MQALRELLGMTRKSLAHELGVSEQMIWLYEAGRRAITKERSTQLARLAQREHVLLHDKAPCPACHGTGWANIQGPPRHLFASAAADALAAALVEPADGLELAQPGDAPVSEHGAGPEPEPEPEPITARGPGRPRIDVRGGPRHIR